MKKKPKDVKQDLSLTTIPQKKSVLDYFIKFIKEKVKTNSSKKPQIEEKNESKPQNGFEQYRVAETPKIKKERPTVLKNLIQEEIDIDDPEI